MKTENFGFDRLTEEYIRCNSPLCARITANTPQKLRYAAGLLLLAFLLCYRWDYFVFAISTFLIFCYALSGAIRIAAAAISLGKNAELNPDPREIEALAEHDLPVYTILLPLYHEEAVAEKIVRRILRLDYPRDRLDVKLLLEPDDTQTRAALEKVTLPPCFEIIDLPDGALRTKPRACNYGLERARGEFLVIYDAEDRPDADQLKKAVALFRRAGTADLSCIQAKLNYYNARQNLLTRLFTVEYSTNFDLQLPGLQYFRLPLPLGGTSNHFRTADLREYGGWDPFNVTEDCDLGIRIYEHGRRTAVMNSTTLEEANSRTGNWMRQRSRWVKGFCQTHLVHYRNPLRTWKRLGGKGFLGCFAFVGASVVMQLTNLLYWPLIALYLVLFCRTLWAGGGMYTVLDIIQGPQYALAASEGFPVFGFHLRPWPLYYAGPLENPYAAGLSQIFFAVGLCLFLLNFVLILVHAAACWKRRFYDLIPYALLMPFYWFLISLAAWKGAFQLLTKPFYWEKTVHGLTRVREHDGKENRHAHPI